MVITSLYDATPQSEYFFFCIAKLTLFSRWECQLAFENQPTRREHPLSLLYGHKKHW